MSTAMQEWPRRHRITVDHYRLMAEAGLFAPDERVQLINGEIVDMPPMGSRHAASLEHLGATLTVAVGSRAVVRQQLPVRLTNDSEPEPDIAVVKARTDRYRSAHPAAPDVLLLVEVSDATLRYDLEVKVPLYARCRIPEVWIVDLRSSELRLFHEPVYGRYTETSTITGGAVLSLRALPELSVELPASLCA